MLFRLVRRRRRLPTPAGRARYITYKEEARALVRAKLAEFNVHYRYPLKKLFIKNLRSRWGSCSSKGNLNFNYRIVLLPPHLQNI